MDYVKDGTLTIQARTIKEVNSIDRVVVYADGVKREYLIPLPTAEERKEGRWVPVDSYSAFGGDEETWEAHGNPIAYHYCSECDEDAQINEFGDEILSKFCPNCGAKMIGE